MENINTKKNIKKMIKTIVKLTIFFLCTILVIFIIRSIFNSEIVKMDKAGYNFVKENIISDELTPIIKVITNMGDAIFIGTLTVILFLAIKDKKISVSIFVNLVLVVFVNHILKNLVQRPRPIGINLITEDGYSFPSGHTMVCTAFYGYLIYLIHKIVKKKYIRIPLNIALGCIIGIIGMSRVYLGVHYFSDVLAGFLISIAYMIAFTTIVKRIIFPNTEAIKNEKVKRIVNSFKYAYEGIISSFKSEQNMKIHFLLGSLVLVFGFILDISINEWFICIFLIAAVISAELFNTAIETIVDIVSPEYNKNAKIAKDVAAGAVLVVAIGAAIIGFIIFVPKLFNYIFF